VTTKYVYDGDQVIAEYDSSDNMLRKFIYGPGIDEPIIIIDVSDNNAVYYYHFDGLGSVAAISDDGGQMTEKYEYDVFGGTTIKDASDNVLTESAIGNPYGFTGRRLDTETDNYYYRMRYYNPDIGRFLQPDPAYAYSSMGLYHYCWNNSINWIDPFGLWTEEAHRNLGRYGRTKFDYARLDIDYSARRSYKNRKRHFRQLHEAFADAFEAAERGDVQAFEYHIHELQDYYSHTAVGKGPVLGHWLSKYDDPTLFENLQRYEQADAITRQLENWWDFHNPEEKCK